MAPTKKEKTKNDLDDALFMFHDKKEELDELLSEVEYAQQPLDRALVNSTLIELVNKWETVVTCYVNFSKARCDEEEEKEAMKECTIRYKFLRKQFVDTKRHVSKYSSRHIGKYSSPTILTSKPNPETQAEVLALCNATNPHARPVMEATPNCVMTQEDLHNYLPMKPFMVDRGVNISINKMSNNQGQVMAITCVSHSMVYTMQGLFAAAVTDFVFEQVEIFQKPQADEPVIKVELGEHQPWTGV
jgi:hypothetical protein